MAHRASACGSRKKSRIRVYKSEWFHIPAPHPKIQPTALYTRLFTRRPQGGSLVACCEHTAKMTRKKSQTTREGPSSEAKPSELQRA